jgi:hypothetical protein
MQLPPLPPSPQSPEGYTQTMPVGHGASGPHCPASPLSLEPVLVSDSGPDDVVVELSVDDDGASVLASVDVELDSAPGEVSSGPAPESSVVVAALDPDVPSSTAADVPVVATGSPAGVLHAATNDATKACFQIMSCPRRRSEIPRTIGYASRPAGSSRTDRR